MSDEGSVSDATRLLDHVPSDLRLVLALTVVLWLVTMVPVLNGTPLRVALAVPYALFVPGYALIAALFPERGPDDVADGPPTDSESTDEQTAGQSGIDGLERLVLSFGSSIAVVPLVGLVLNFTPWGIRLVPILVALTIVTVGLVVIGTRRRSRLPADRRFDPEPAELLRRGIEDLRTPGDRAELVVNVVLVLSVCLAAGSVAYAVTSPGPSESFTEFYLLTENDSGELVADGYPTNMTAGQEQSLVVGIGNNEGKPVRYTVVTELQRVGVDGENVTVREREQLDRFSRRVADNETVQVRRTFSPGLVGDRLRLQFRLYRGGSATVDGTEAPYREVHLWVRVSSSSGGQNAEVVIPTGEYTKTTFLPYGADSSVLTWSL